MSQSEVERLRSLLDSSQKNVEELRRERQLLKAGEVASLMNAAPELLYFVIQYLYSEHGICAPTDEAAPYSPEQLRDMAVAVLAKAKGGTNE